MNKKFQIVYYNDWGNRIPIYAGTLEECQTWYEDHILKCESLDVQIEEYHKDFEKEFPEL